MISVLILTKDEEQCLPLCLNSVSWSDDVIVFDSFSTDRTVKVAQAAGARVVQRAFDNYASQREAARTQVNYRYPWVLAVDADEVVEQDLAEEIQRLVRTDAGDHAAYRMRRKDTFMGRWIKHATLYPSWFVRFYRPARIHYGPRAVHEYPTVEGHIGELRGHLVHYNFSKGLGQWLERHNRYSTIEAEESLKSLARRPLPMHALFRSDPVARRRALKELSFRLPCRPLLRFFYMYLLRLGFLDGIPGYHYCRLLAIYEYMIVLKMKEIRRRQQGLPR
jgi:glycosyltransferase involved in cell wall biosynthesis